MFKIIKNIFKGKENGVKQPSSFRVNDIFINSFIAPSSCIDISFSNYCNKSEDTIKVIKYNIDYNNVIKLQLEKTISNPNVIDFIYYKPNKNKILTRMIPIKKDFNDCFYVQFFLLVKGLINSNPYSVYRVLFCNEIESIKVDILNDDLLYLLKKYTNEDCLNQVKKGTLSFGVDISPVKYQKLKNFLTNSGINKENAKKIDSIRILEDLKGYKD